jgi:transketolase
VLTRQDVPTIDRNRYASADGLRHGAYVLADSPGGAPELILVASGSEVALVIEAACRLQDEGLRIRVVSMPSWELFDALPQAERDAVLPPAVRARMAVEAGVSQGWHRYVGDAGDVNSVERFGSSAPGAVLLREYGFGVEEVCRRALQCLSRQQVTTVSPPRYSPRVGGG